MSIRESNARFIRKDKTYLKLLGCYVSKCAMSLELTHFCECKFVMQFMQMRWMLVINTHFYGQIAPKDVSSRLLKGKKTCSKNGMSFLTMIRSQKEPNVFGKYLSALREGTYFYKLPSRSSEVSFTIGLARRKIYKPIGKIYLSSIQITQF